MELKNKVHKELKNGNKKYLYSYERFALQDIGNYYEWRLTEFKDKFYKTDKVSKHRWYNEMEPNEFIKYLKEFAIWELGTLYKNHTD